MNMKSNVTPFCFGDHLVRVVEDSNQNPLFVAKDVANALGYVNTRDAISKHCKGVANHYPLQTSGGKQEVRVIKEPDVYRLIVKSQLPEKEYMTDTQENTELKDIL